MLFSVQEIIDIILMCGFVGYIFYQKPSHADNDPFMPPARFSWRAFWFGVAVAAPAIVLHEFGHKFVGLAFGLAATYVANYPLLILGAILKFVGFPFIFIIPAYVSLSGSLDPTANFWVSFAGPAINIILWLTAYLLLKFNKLPQKYMPYAIMTRNLNGLLAIMNMIPIPGFDGFWVFGSLLAMFGVISL